MSLVAVVLMSGDRVRKIGQLMCTNVKIALQKPIANCPLLCDFYINLHKFKQTHR